MLRNDFSSENRNVKNVEKMREVSALKFIGHAYKSDVNKRDTRIVINRYKEAGNVFFLNFFD